MALKIQHWYVRKRAQKEKPEDVKLL